MSRAVETTGRACSPRPGRWAALSLAVVLVLGAVFLGAVFLGAASSAAGDAPADPDAPGLSPGERFTALLARARHEQTQLQSLEARFVERKESELLLTPEESQGTLAYLAPDRVRWDFTSPDELTVVVCGQEMTTRFPDRIERVEVGSQMDHVLRFLGPGSSLETLKEYFTFKATFPKDPAAPYELELTPRFERVARRIETMTLHLDRERFVPVYLRYVGPGGEAVEFRFADVRINVPIPPERFTLEPPAASPAP